MAASNRWQQIKRESFIRFIRNNRHEVDSSGYRQSKSVWGRCARTLLLQNRMDIRKWLYIQYKRDIKGIRTDEQEEPQEKEKNGTRKVGRENTGSTQTLNSDSENKALSPRMADSENEAPGRTMTDSDNDGDAQNPRMVDSENEAPGPTRTDSDNDGDAQSSRMADSENEAPGSTMTDSDNDGDAQSPRMADSENESLGPTMTDSDNDGDAQSPRMADAENEALGLTMTDSDNDSGAQSPRMADSENEALGPTMTDSENEGLDPRMTENEDPNLLMTESGSETENLNLRMTDSEHDSETSSCMEEAQKKKTQEDEEKKSKIGREKSKKSQSKAHSPRWTSSEDENLSLGMMESECERDLYGEKAPEEKEQEDEEKTKKTHGEKSKKSENAKATETESEIMENSRKTRKRTKKPSLARKPNDMNDANDTEYTSVNSFQLDEEESNSAEKEGNEHQEKQRGYRCQEKMSKGVSKCGKKVKKNMRVFCICRKPDDGRPYVWCNLCDEWYHFDCVGYNPQDYSSQEEYICEKCSATLDDMEVASDDENEAMQGTSEQGRHVDELENISDQESVNTSTAEYFESPQKFRIRLSKEEWDKVKPRKKKNALAGEWTSLVAERFAQKNPYCVLRFTYNRTKKAGSRKCNTPYVRLTASCKFQGCAKYSFVMRKEPAAHANHVSLRVYRTGSVCHHKSRTHKRNLKGSERTDTGKDLESQGVSMWYYGKLSGMSCEKKVAGNINECKTPDVLRKALSEQRHKDQLHCNPLQEVLILQDLYNEMDGEEHSTGISGFIQYFSVSPFKVHLYSSKQLQLYRTQCRTGETVVHIDATGSLINKIPGQPKGVLYYAMVVENPLPGKAGIPVAEMLSNDQRSSEIQHFVTRFLHAAAKGQAISTVAPRQIETDYSWAMIQAVLSACNKEDCQTYLTRVWNIVHGTSSQWKGYTYVHICAAHVLKDVAKHAVKICPDKGLRQFFLYCFGLLQTSSHLNEALTIFADMCRIFDSEHENVAVNKSLRKLKGLICQDEKEIINQEMEKVENIYITTVESEPARLSSIKSSSRWRRIFTEVFTQMQNEKPGGENKPATNIPNPYFCPKLLSVLLDNFLHIFPLWSAVLLGDLDRYSEGNGEKDTTSATSKDKSLRTKMRHTNAIVENWFGVVKKDFLSSKRLRLRPGLFIRKTHMYVKGRLGEIEVLQKPRELKPRRRGKRKHDDFEKVDHSERKEAQRTRNRSAGVEKDDEIPDAECQEGWQPKKQKIQREGKYFTPPKTMPAPKTKRSNPHAFGKEDVRNRQTLSTVPSWGGQTVYKGKHITLVNTCPIDFC